MIRKIKIREMMTFDEYMENVFEHNRRLNETYNPKPINLKKLFK